MCPCVIYRILGTSIGGTFMSLVLYNSVVLFTFWVPCWSLVLYNSVVLFTFWVPCCSVRYDFRIKAMFSLSLPPVVCRRAHILFTLFVFVCVLWCPKHIALCVLFCLFSSCVLCTQCCQFLKIVQFLLPLQ